MKKPNIITPVLKYWKFEEHPFADIILKEDNEVPIAVSGFLSS